MLQKIISGAQTGADQAALLAAHSQKYEIGGWMPEGFKTEDGPRPSFQHKYGMEETKSFPNYRNRTQRNVIDSDGTLWFGNPTSPGGKLTINSARKHKRPVLIIPRDATTFDAERKIITWIRKEEIETLNVAGNRASKNPDIYGFVYMVMLRVLKNI